MATIKKILNVVFSIVEDVLPTVSFFGMFLAFLIQIVSRYIFNKPLFWADELVTITYMWLVFMGAACVMRKKGHINFTIVYDAVPPVVQAIFRIVGEIVMIVFILLAMPDCFDFLGFLQFDKTVVLRLPVAIYYFPMGLASILIALHLAVNLVEDSITLVKEIKHV